MPDGRIERLRQEETESWFCGTHGTGRWTTVYREGTLGADHIALFSYLVSPEDWVRHSDNPGWCFSPGHGLPGFSQGYGEAGEITIYHRYGTDESYEPIVTLRAFPNHRGSYLEVVEEFRHLFNLCEDRDSGSFFLIDENGEETEVIRVSEDEVEINTALLSRYLAVKQKCLVLAIDSFIFGDLVSEVSIDLPDNHEVRGGDLCLDFYSGTTPGKVFSRLFGKKLIGPPCIIECGIWPYEEPEEYIYFIIGEDDRGRSIEHTSNPELLSDYFGGNAGAPPYVAPVFFSSEVMRKYYDNPLIYEVGDGYIRRQGIWYLRIDNDTTGHIVVFLGDLGRDLPTIEQRYWRAFNIMPAENRMSETAVRRSFLSQWTDPRSPEHRFKQAYLQINAAWLEFRNWKLFREPHIDDRHNLSRLRIPLVNDPAEFDVQLLCLAKVLIDLLNEEEIEQATASQVAGAKGIAKLGQLLGELGYPYVDRDIDLLLTIQGVRSKGVAHCKGSDYDITKAGLDPEDLQASFSELLDRATQMLEDLKSFIDRQVRQQ